MLDAAKSIANSLLSITAPPFDFKSSDKTAELAAKPSPANSVANPATVDNCSVLPSESNVNNLSPFAGVTSLNSDISTVKVTPPDAPPPLNPTPAVTPVISPL